MRRLARAGFYWIPIPSLLLGTDGPSQVPQHMEILELRAVSGLRNLTRVDPPSPSPPGPSSLLPSGACSFWTGEPYLCLWKIFNTQNINIRPPLCPLGNPEFLSMKSVSHECQIRQEDLLWPRRFKDIQRLRRNLIKSSFTESENVGLAVVECRVLVNVFDKYLNNIYE